MFVYVNASESRLHISFCFFPINKFNKYEYIHHTRCVSQDDVDDVHHPVGGEVVPLDDVPHGEVAGDGELAREGRHLLLLILLLLLLLLLLL